MRYALVVSAVLGCTVLSPMGAVAAEKPYPTRPVRLVVAQTPGSSIDAMAGVVTI